MTDAQLELLLWTGRLALAEDGTEWRDEAEREVLKWQQIVERERDNPAEAR